MDEIQTGLRSKEDKNLRDSRMIRLFSGVRGSHHSPAQQSLSVGRAPILIAFHYQQQSITLFTLHFTHHFHPPYMKSCALCTFGYPTLCLSSPLKHRLRYCSSSLSLSLSAVSSNNMQLKINNLQTEELACRESSSGCFQKARNKPPSTTKISYIVLCIAIVSYTYKQSDLTVDFIHD